jgi:hypothetical protein
MSVIFNVSLVNICLLSLKHLGRRLSEHPSVTCHVHKPEREISMQDLLVVLPCHTTSQGTCILVADRAQSDNSLC